jgi:hypothetical protein
MRAVPAPCSWLCLAGGRSLHEPQRPGQRAVPCRDGTERSGCRVPVSRVRGRPGRRAPAHRCASSDPDGARARGACRARTGPRCRPLRPAWTQSRDRRRSGYRRAGAQRRVLHRGGAGHGPDGGHDRADARPCAGSGRGGGVHLGAHRLGRHAGAAGTRQLRTGVHWCQPRLPSAIRALRRRAQPNERPPFLATGVSVPCGRQENADQAHGRNRRLYPDP